MDNLSATGHVERGRFKLVDFIMKVSQKTSNQKMPFQDFPNKMQGIKLKSLGERSETSLNANTENQTADIFPMLRFPVERFFFQALNLVNY